MINLESRKGIAKGSQEQVFNYISDFRNFSHLIPEEKLNSIEITEKSIVFEMTGMGTIGLAMDEYYPYSKIVVRPVEGTSADFTIVIHIASITPDSSEVMVHLTANLNMFIEMMAKSPLQRFLDLMIDKVEAIDFR